MNTKQRLKDHLESLHTLLANDLRIITEHFNQKKDTLKEAYSSEFDRLRLDALKYACIALSYRKHGLFEPLTPEEQAVMRELETQQSMGKCPLRHAMGKASYCTLPFELGIPCRYRSKDKPQEVYLACPCSSKPETVFLCNFIERGEAPHEWET
jgi:hypothetical protein